MNHIRIANRVYCIVFTNLSHFHWTNILIRTIFLFLFPSTDESATEAILKAMQAYANMCGKLSLNTPRDAFITALCKASLPPHYTLTILNTQATPHQLHKRMYYSCFCLYYYILLIIIKLYNDFYHALPSTGHHHAWH